MSDKNYLRIKATTPYYNFVRKFAFPTLHEILLMMLIVDALGGAIVYCMYSPSLRSLVSGMTFGLLVFSVPSVVSSLTIHTLVLRGDLLFNLRRCFALSLFSSTIWILVMVLGALVNRSFHVFVFPGDAFYLGMFVVAPFRTISIFSMSSVSGFSKSFSVTLEPCLSVVCAALFFQVSIFEGVLVFLGSAVISFTYATLIISYLERRGMSRMGMSPLLMFRGFLLDWLDRCNGVLEKHSPSIRNHTGH